jgi:hypothetical protein
MIDIAAVDHGIDGQQQVLADDLGGEGALAKIGTLVASDVIGRGCLAILKRDLDVIETGNHKPSQRFGRDANGRCDEIGVKTGIVCSGSDFHKVSSRGWFAT